VGIGSAAKKGITCPVRAEPRGSKQTNICSGREPLQKRGVIQTGGKKFELYSSPVSSRNNNNEELNSSDWLIIERGENTPVIPIKYLFQAKEKKGERRKNRCAQFDELTTVMNRLAEEYSSGESRRNGGALNIRV